MFLCHILGIQLLGHPLSTHDDTKSQATDAVGCTWFLLESSTLDSTCQDPQDLGSEAGSQAVLKAALEAGVSVAIVAQYASWQPGSLRTLGRKG